MKHLFRLFFIIVAVQALALGTLSAQVKPAAASPISDQLMPTISKSDIIAQRSLFGLTSIATAQSSALAGGNRLVAMQYTDGGWGWPLTAPPTYGNILGPIAMGLAQAYQQTGNSTQKTSLFNAGAYLLAKTNNFSPSDGYLAAQLDKIFGVTTYTAHVKTNFYDKLADSAYNRNGAGVLYSTATYVELIQTNRHAWGQGNLAAWDIGMGLVGASMCAESTTEWITGVKEEIDLLDGSAYYDVIGLAGAIYGLAFVNEDYDPISGEHAAAGSINDLANILLGYQISGGGFTWNSDYVSSGNETNQETAYAILALNEINRTLYLTSITGAADYLMSVQLGTGGWDNYPGDPDGENNEMTGEVLWGISVAYPPPVHNVTKDLYYPTIPGAISDASAGNLIQVSAGTYPGTITINKSVTLLGDPGDAGPGPGANAPVIDGAGANIDAFKITNGVSNVTIKGFVIQNFSSPGYNTLGSGIQAWVGSTSYITVQDNSFLNLGYNGILVGNDYNSDPSKWSDHTYWTVKNNIVSNCGYIGFELTNTSNSSIEGNVIHLNTPYIGAIFSSARRNETALTIKDNLIDGTPSGVYPVVYVYAYDCDMASPNLNGLLIEGNGISTVGTPAQVYIRNINTGTITNVTVTKNNFWSLRTNITALINAADNYWGSPNGPAHPDNVFNVGSQGGTVTVATGGTLPLFCPWWKDISGAPGSYTGTSFAPIVNNDAPAESFCNFTAAISGTTADGIINAAAGTYTEGSPQIVIGKNISIVGEDKNTTILKPAQNTGSSGDARGWILVNSGNTFNLSNFTLDGSGKLVNIGILSHGPGVIDNNILMNIGYNPSGPDYTGRAIAFYDVNMSLTNNTLSNIGRIGLYIYGAAANAGVISGNSYTGKGDGNWLDYGIEIEGGAHATITGNTVTDCRGVATVDGSTSAGMLITTYFALGSQALLTGNAFTDNTVGIAVGYASNDQSTVVARHNDFSGNTDYGILSTNPFVDAEYNDWGAVLGPLDAVGSVEMPGAPTTPVAQMKNTIPDGKLGVPVSENVDYYPWNGPARNNARGGGVWAGGYVNPTSNQIFAGFDIDALDGVDGRDSVAPPPPPSDYLYLYFLLAPGQPLENYASDVKKDEASLASAAKHWDLKAVTDHTSELVSIEFPLTGLPAGFKPTLYDLASGGYQNLRDNPLYSYTSPATVVPSSFLLLMGDSTQPAAAVTSPNGGEFLVVGQPYTISWSSSDGTGILRHYIYCSLTGAAPYTLIDSTDGAVSSYIWTPGTASDIASIKIVARDSVMNENYDISDHTFNILTTNTVAFSALAGWNLISPAMLQGVMTPSGLFGDDYGATPYYTFGFNTASGYSIPATLSMGQGYWLGSNSPQTVDATGTPVVSANLLLSDGFNIIGNPFAAPLLKSDLRFFDGVETKDIVQASSAGWLSNVLYGYDGSGYVSEATALGVWKGYWIPMLEPDITIQYLPSVGVPTPMTVPVAAELIPSGWNLDISAQFEAEGVQYTDRVASFGVHENATEQFDPSYDAPRPPRSPSAEYVEIGFSSNQTAAAGKTLARDFKNIERMEWEFTVNTSREGTVTLTWDNSGVSKLPGDVKILMYDQTGRRTVDMKRVGSYSFDQTGTLRRFTVNKSENTVPVRFELGQNYPNPFNPTTTIEYGLPFDANVVIEIYDNLGRKIATPFVGSAQAGYHEVKFDATLYSSGLYLYRITATATDGATVTESRKMTLVK